MELKLDMKTPLVILLMNEVFPTAASPAKTTFKKETRCIIQINVRQNILDKISQINNAE